MDPFMEGKEKTPYWQQYVDACEQSEAEFIAEAGHTIKLYFATKKSNIGKKLPILLNAHGGGCCICKAKDETAFICKMATQNDMHFVNVEFRNAPEAKAPGGA